MTGVSAPLYVGFLTVAMSAAAALATSRGMDRLTDRRAVDRRTNVALMRIRFLAVELFAVERLLRAMMVDDPARLRSRNQYIARVTRVGLAAKSLPDFDALIQREADIFPATLLA
jgi:hypothetical protein